MKKNSDSILNWQEARKLFEPYMDKPPKQAVLEINSDDNIPPEVKSKLIKLIQSQSKSNTLLDNPDLSFFSSIDKLQEDLSGKHIDDYKLLEKIGIGGMSHVYKANRKDAGIQKPVAIKVMVNYQGKLDANLSKLFIQEQHTLVQLNHTNIISFHHGGISQEGIPYLVIEYIENAINIKDYCLKNKLSTFQILDLVLPLMDAISYTHQQLIVHKDIKPQNILVDAHAVPLLLDFGISAIDEHKNDDNHGDKNKIYTPGYASPEQILGNKVTTSSDVFSFTAMLLDLLTNKKPLPDFNTEEYLFENSKKHIDSIIEQAEIETDLKNILKKGLAEKPKDRYATMQEMKQDLLNFKSLLPVLASKSSKFYKIKLWIKRNKYIAILISSLLVAALLFINYRYQSIKQQKIAEKHLILVHDIKSNLRRTHMLPLHNVQEVYAKTIRKIETLQASILNNESHSNGLSEYAIGSAYSSMREFDKALIYLQKSADKGWDSPELFSELGFVLAVHWDDIIIESYSINDKIKREKFLNKNKLKYLEPAKKHLAQASKGLATHNYVSAYLAALNENYDEAIQYTLKEIKNNPWFYEAYTYISFLYIEKAIPLLNKKGYKAAKPYIDLSKQYMQQAINIGSSDPNVYKEYCSNYGFNIQVELQYDAINIDETFSNGVKVCQQAIEMLSYLDTASNHIDLIKLYTQYADYHISQGTSHIEYINKANEVSNQGLKLYPDDSRLLAGNAQSLLELAKEAIKEGKDPTSFYHKAKTQINKSLKINPNERSTWLKLGFIQKEIASYYSSINNFIDAGPHYEESIKAYDRVEKLGNEFIALANKAITQQEYAKSKKMQGQFHKSIELFRKSLENSEKIFKFNTESYVIYANYFEFQFDLVKILKENNLSYINELNHAIKSINNSCKHSYLNKSHVKQIQFSMDYFIHNNLATSSNFSLCNQKIIEIKTN